MLGVTRALRATVGPEQVPAWSQDLPAGGSPRRPRADPAPRAVFVPSCLGSVFAPAPGHPGVASAFARLCSRAGVGLRVPADIDSLCCGTPWKSKGMTAGYDTMRQRLVASLRLATRGGRLPVVCDAVSCTEGLAAVLAEASAQFEHPPVVTDAVRFTEEHVMPALQVTAPLDRVTLHPTCSSTRLGVDGSARRLAATIAGSVTVVDEWSCCGFAGDRGLLHPELTASATRRQAQAVTAQHFDAHLSLNRTCEVAMTRATDRDYHHLLEACEHATRPASE